MHFLYSTAPAPPNSEKNHDKYGEFLTKDVYGTKVSVETEEDQFKVAERVGKMRAINSDRWNRSRKTRQINVNFLLILIELFEFVSESSINPKQFLPFFIAFVQVIMKWKENGQVPGILVLLVQLE